MDNKGGSCDHGRGWNQNLGGKADLMQEATSSIITARARLEVN